MGRVKEQTTAYGPKKKLRTQQFIYDRDGNRVGVFLDLKTYERLVEAKEKLDDVRAYDESIGSALAAYKKGDYITLEQYRKLRKKRQR